MDRTKSYTNRPLNDPEQLIFVSIASYRDPQLTPTVLDCIRKARNPDRLRFGICRQRGEEEDPFSFREDPRFRILEVDWRQSKGACWARSEIMRLWQGEDWFLQVDSHCRFAVGWDELLLRSAADTGSKRPILSTYPASFTPGQNEVLADDPLQVAFHAFTADGIPQLRPRRLPERRTPGSPLQARFLAAGFLFTLGRFAEEVPYDPDLYFIGEEAAMSVRAFTHGYDLFHPAETIVWHDYGRHNARRHWGDHTGNDATTRPWAKLDEASRRKVSRLLSGEPVGSFGLGSQRTLEEYESYAGLSFRERKAQQYTLRGEEPPNPEAPANWTDAVQPWIVKIPVPRARLPHGALDDPKLWFVGIHDLQGFEIYQQNLTPQELEPLKGDREELAIVCEFFSESAPASWVLWPLSQSQGLLSKIEGPFRDEDFAILVNEEDQKVENAAVSRS
jgi:hypothetical protein